MTPPLADLLLVICNALLLPVVVLLLAMIVGCLVYTGGFVTEAIGRARHRPAFTRAIEAIKRGSPLPADLVPCPGLVAQAMNHRATAPQQRDKVLDDLQLQAERLLGRLQMGVRLGPMLGLAGTLIPLGPALQALADGKIDALAQQLIVAFSTTVLGLVVGGVCFALHSVRQAWYTQDLSDIAFLFQFQDHVPCSDPDSR